jgi:hypothetical protein
MLKMYVIVKMLELCFLYGGTVVFFLQPVGCKMQKFENHWFKRLF